MVVVLYGKTKYGNIVSAVDAFKELDYYCPLCHQKLTLKQGLYKSAHFAHRGQNCNYKEETYAHYQAKYALGQQLKELGYCVQIEPYLKQSHQIPDILINNKIILEIQCSTITIKLLQRRTNTYERLGYIVIWIIEDDIRHNELITLNGFQSACIIPNKLKLFLWNNELQSLICLKNLIAIGGNRFLGEKIKVNISEFFDDDKMKSKHYKLTNNSIQQFLKQCRSKRSVIEPSLSVMYNLKLSDTWVLQNLGFIFPEQIYLKSHPIFWQLQLLKLLMQKSYSLSLFMQAIDFRKFAYSHIQYEQIVSQLVQQFKRQFSNFKGNNVQK